MINKTTADVANSAKPDAIVVEKVEPAVAAPAPAPAKPSEGPAKA